MNTQICTNCSGGKALQFGSKKTTWQMQLKQSEMLFGEAEAQ
jgi:hypothetical protein